MVEAAITVEGRPRVGNAQGSPPEPAKLAEFSRARTNFGLKPVSIAEKSEF
jgi:hypothetical protein